MGVLIYWNGQFSKPSFSHFIPKLNYNKVVCITLIDLFYQLRHLFTFYKHFNYYSKYHDTVSYSDIFGNGTQYYCLVVSHIPINNYYLVKLQYTCISGLHLENISRGQKLNLKHFGGDIQGWCAVPIVNLTSRGGIQMPLSPLNETLHVP